MASKLFIKGKQLSGAVANALRINCKDKDGNKSTVQAELNTLQDEIAEVKNEVSEQNSTMIKVAEIIIEVTTVASSGIFGNNYKYIDISKELSDINATSILSVSPISATKNTNNGICGVIGRYSTTGSHAAWALATPSAGTYKVIFGVIYI